MYDNILDIGANYTKGGNKRLVNFYSNKYHIQAAILDIILRHGEVNYHQLESSVFGEYGTEEAMTGMPYSYYNVYLRELCATGVIKVRIKGVADDEVIEYVKKELGNVNDVLTNIRIQNELKNKSSFILTDVGLQLIRSQTFHSNALAALTARQMCKLSRLTILSSFIAIIISIIALCVK